MTDAMPRGRALAALLLSLAGLVVVGRLAVDAWLLRPVPTRVRVVQRAPSGVPRPFLLGIVDGLRAEAVEDDLADPAMPFWRSMQARGAWGIGVTGEPTMTAACVRTIVTGRNPDLVAAFRNFDAAPTEGSVHEFLAARGLRLAHAGDASAFQLVRRHVRPEDALAFPDVGPRDQGETDDRCYPFALEKARDPGVSVLTFHVVRPDHAGHRYGATGAEYRAACRAADEQMRGVYEAFVATRPDALVLITADHGVTPRGTHGGGEPGARRAPFVLVGPRVARRGPAEVPQAALAPTLAALLDLPMPPLAESPPALELTTLSPTERMDALDAFLQARLATAASMGDAEVAAALDARRRLVFSEGPNAAVGRLAELYRELEERALGRSGRGPAVLAVLLAVLWLAALVAEPGAGRARSWAFACGVLALWLATASTGGAGARFASEPAVGVAAVALAAVAFARPVVPVLGTRTLCVAGLLAVPALGGAGLLLQNAFDAPGGAGPAATRTAVVAALLAVAALALLSRRDARRRLAAPLAVRPGLLVALGGGLLGFGLSLRLFVDPFVHTPILFAAAAGVGLLVALLPSRVRAAAPGAVATLLAVAALLLVGGRVAEGLSPDWVLGPAGESRWFLLAAAAALAPVVVAAARAARGGGRDAFAVGVAPLLLVSAVFSRASLLRSASPRHGGRAGGVLLLAASPFVAGADARLAVRLLGCAALGAIFHERSDAQVLGVALTVAAGLALSRVPVPASRTGLAALAVLLLAVRIAVFHALGFSESFSTIDVGAGVVPGARGDGATAGADGWTPAMLETALHLAVKFALVWVVLLAGLARAFERAGHPHALRTVVFDLAVAFAARGALLAIGMTVWWRSSWWVATAYPVFTLGAADVVLVLAAAAVSGAFRRDGAPALAPA